MPLRKRTPVRKNAPKKRATEFIEVSLGYSVEEALQEASRCLQCKNPPCSQGCPVGVEISEFINKIKHGDFQGAGDIIRSKNSLPSICGRVCPQEDQCEAFCILGKKGEPIAIGLLERFAADNSHPTSTKSPKDVSSVQGRVAVVGSGPAGLTAAAELRRMGYHVTIFEALHKPGGVLTYGIPEFRLPKDVVQKEIRLLEKLGVELQTDVIIGKLYTLDELLEKDYDAVFIATGAGSPRFLNIPGEDLNGVLTANEFLTKSNLMQAHKFPEYDTPIHIGKRVVVVGGGNVAIDSARTALRFGAEEVTVIYRRSREEMPARREEVENAEEEGVKFQYLATPIRILGNKNSEVIAIECQRMRLGKSGSDGRRTPILIEGETFIIETPTIIIAIGTEVNPLIQRTTRNLKTNNKGHIIIEEQTGKTSRDLIYAGGDVTTGSDTVIQAMGAGKKAAKAIDLTLKKSWKSDSEK